MSSMLRLIDGVLYEGKHADEHELVIHRLGNGHAEASVRRTVHWRELKVASPDELELWRQHREETADERDEANRKRAARRGTTNVRRLVKVSGMDALLTLTYRELQTDLALCKKHLKEFVRRMNRLIPDWPYVAAFERQERGAWHVHLAIHRLPMTLTNGKGIGGRSYNVVRAVWRSVVGLDNGNVDQSLRKRSSRFSSARVAAYISKYMLKAFQDGVRGSNRYSYGNLDALPPPERVRFQAAGMGDLIALAYSEIASCAVDIWTSCRRNLEGAVDGFFISTSPPGPVRRYGTEVPA